MTTPAHLTWVTTADVVTDHAVTDDAMAAGMASRGVYQALCGALFVSAPMTADPGRVCQGCRMFILAQASLRSAEQRMTRGRHHPRHARPGVFARMTAALTTPAIPYPRSADSVAPASAGRHALRGTR